MTGQYEADEAFGWCPDCGRSDGYLNVEATHWYVCHAHRVRWCVGANLFSSWRYESEADWQKNADLLRTYREVDGQTPTVIMLQRQALTGTFFAEGNGLVWF
jgi:hypothetical protein